MEEAPTAERHLARHRPAAVHRRARLPAVRPRPSLLADAPAVHPALASAAAAIGTDVHPRAVLYVPHTKVSGHHQRVLLSIHRHVRSPDVDADQRRGGWPGYADALHVVGDVVQGGAVGVPVVAEVEMGRGGVGGQVEVEVVDEQPRGRQQRGRVGPRQRRLEGERVIAAVTAEAVAGERSVTLVTYERLADALWPYVWKQ